MADRKLPGWETVSNKSQNKKEYSIYSTEGKGRERGEGSEEEGNREREREGGKGEAVSETHRSSTGYLTNAEKKTGDSRRLGQAKQPSAVIRATPGSLAEEGLPVSPSGQPHNT